MLCRLGDRISCSYKLKELEQQKTHRPIMRHRTDGRTQLFPLCKFGLKLDK